MILLSDALRIVDDGRVNVTGIKCVKVGFATRQRPFVKEARLPLWVNMRPPSVFAARQLSTQFRTLSTCQYGPVISGYHQSMGQSRRAMSTIPWDREGIPGVSLHGNDPAALPAAIGRVAFETLQASGTRKAEHRIRAAEKSFQAAHSKRPARGRRAKRTLPLGTPFLENWP